MKGIEYALKLMNMERKELADILGIRKQNIDYWVNQRPVPKKYLEKIGQILLISPNLINKELDSFDKEYIMKMTMLKDCVEPDKATEVQRDILIEKFKGFVDKSNASNFHEVATVLNLMDRVVGKGDTPSKFNQLKFLMSCIVNEYDVSSNIGSEDFNKFLIKFQEPFKEESATANYIVEDFKGQFKNFNEKLYQYTKDIDKKSNN